MMVPIVTELLVLQFSREGSNLPNFLVRMYLGIATLSGCRAPFLQRAARSIGGSLFRW